jgi:Peptidase family M28
MDDIRRLCSFEGRRAGTDAERRAANWLVERLRSMGRRAEVEPTYVHPQWGLAAALHCLLALAGSLVAITAPAVGFAIVLATAFSLYLDLNARFYLLRLLFFRRASQNVVSRGTRPDAPGRLIVTAHYDAPRTGAAYQSRWRDPGERLARFLPVPISPARVVFWSMALLLPALGLRMAGIDDNWVSVLQLPPTLILIVAIFLLVDLELSEVVPGANVNASGVATALSVADELERDASAHLEVWVVLPGAGEALSEGMRAFIRAHRDELDPDTTWFVNLEGVGDGRVRYETSQGRVVSFGMASRLTELCAAIADADRDGENAYGAEPLRSGFSSDSLPPLLAGFPATTIRCLAKGQLIPTNYRTAADVPDAIAPEELERAHAFTLELIRALDRDVERTVEPSDAAVV